MSVVRILAEVVKEWEKETVLEKKGKRSLQLHELIATVHKAFKQILRDKFSRQKWNKAAEMGQGQNTLNKQISC